MQRKIPVTITLRGELLQRVDELAGSKSQNRSQFVSDLLERFLPKIEQEVSAVEQQEARVILGRSPTRTKAIPK